MDNEEDKIGAELTYNEKACTELLKKFSVFIQYKKILDWYIKEEVYKWEDLLNSNKSIWDNKKKILTMYEALKNLSNQYNIYNDHFIPSRNDIKENEFEILGNSFLSEDEVLLFNFIYEFPEDIYNTYINIKDVYKRSKFLLIHYEFYKLIESEIIESYIYNNENNEDFIEKFIEAFDTDGEIFNQMHPDFLQ